MKMKSIGWSSPNTICIFIKRGNVDRDRHAQRGLMGKQREDGSHVTAVPSASRGCMKRQGRVPQSSQGASGPASTLVWEFWSLDLRVNFCGLSSQFGALIKAPLGNEHRGVNAPGVENGFQILTQIGIVSV